MLTTPNTGMRHSGTTPTATAIAGQTISFKVKVKNLDRSVTYTVQVRAASRTDAIRFNSCTSSMVSRSIILASGTTGTAEKTKSVSVNPCTEG